MLETSPCPLSERPVPFDQSQRTLCRGIGAEKVTREAVPGVALLGHRMPNFGIINYWPL
jgi:hypothetical protein